MNVLSGQILRFFFFIEDFVVGRSHTSKLDRAGFVTLRISSARCYRNVRTVAYFTIWVCGKMSKRIVPPLRCRVW